MKSFSILVISLLSAMNSIAQGAYIPLQAESYHLLDRMDILDDSNFTGMHMGVKPFDRAKIFQPYIKDSLNQSASTDDGSRDDFNRMYLYKDNMEWNGGRPIGSAQKPLLKIFYKEEASFLVFNDKDFTLRINPVIQLAGGSKNSLGKYLIENRKGVEVRGTIAKRVSFYTLITDNQERLPDYGVQYANGQFGQNNYVSNPGNTYFKPYKTDGYDYFNVRGYVNFNFLKYFDIQLGHDKNFYGNGVRSLFLSDQSAPYFFFKLNTRIWKINYQNVFAELTHQYIRGADKLLPKKYGVFHHLNFAVTKNLDLGLFEGVILSRNKGFELQYLNPIIFYRAIEQSLGSPDNAVVGADFKFNVKRTVQFYGQFLLDEFNFGEISANKGWWGNKLGAQLGIKYIDAFKVKNLDLQGEFNMVTPYTYTHRSPAITDSAANYTHYNQSLAHPLGANFREIVFVARYQPIKRLNTQFKWFNTARGADTTGQSWGSDVFYPASANSIPKEYGNSLLQGYRTEVNLFELRFSYMLYHNLFIDLHGTYRKSVSELSSLNSSEVYIGAGVRLNISRRENEY